ncbi:MAG: hypothetical protein ACYS8L_01145, partial [Planctomycetota bacterium]
MTEAVATHQAHDHEHFGTVHTRLILTFIGGVLVLNAYVAGYLLFPEDPIVGEISGFLGALILAAPIVIGGLQEMKRGRMHMSVLVAIAVVAAFALGDYKEAGIVAFFMLL